MSLVNLTQFLEQYFTANHCTVHFEEQNSMKIDLTEEMDRAIMNRPFYWQYVQATNQVGQPMTLTWQIATDEQTSQPEKKQGQTPELIHFGSAKLHAIFQQLRHSARFVRLFENIEVQKNTMLYPWLVVNFIVSFSGKQKKDELFSIGLQLINGTIILNMMDRLSNVSLDEQISDYCYTISPIIMKQSGFKRIENKIFELLEDRCYKWAFQSIEALREEIKLINHFYKNRNEIDQLQKEIEEAKTRYEPKIIINPFSAGIFYLTESFTIE